MTHLEAALLELAGFLDARGSRYMVVGGLAALHWGRQRLTRDLDLTVDVPVAALEDFIADLGAEFQLVDHDAVLFAGPSRSN